MCVIEGAKLLFVLCCLGVFNSGGAWVFLLCGGRKIDGGIERGEWRRRERLGGL